MPISDRILKVTARLAFLLAFLAGQECRFAFAFDVKEDASAPAEKGTLFKSVGEAIREGIRNLKQGDSSSAVEPLTFAAREGNVAAQWKLGRMYSDGEGVRRDDYKAYHYFSQIVNKRADESPDSPNARVVAQAFVALGTYHLTGIPNTRVKRDPARAADMFHYAASYFNDAEAQYHLGRIFAEGITGTQDLQQAARWYNLAAEKGHFEAQARLGQMLFKGEGVPRQAPRGLMWMKLAVKRADPTRDAWIIELSEQALETATEDEIKLSDFYLKKQERAMR